MNEVQDKLDKITAYKSLIEKRLKKDSAALDYFIKEKEGKA